MATPTTKSNKPAQVAPLAIAKAAASPTKVAPTVKAAAAPAGTDTKTAREHKATRDACAAVRKEMLITDVITRGKANNSRPGSLRFNIVEAIATSKTVGEACTKQVHGGKYVTEPYAIKKVDCGFALGNGFITTKPAASK